MKKLFETCITDAGKREKLTPEERAKMHSVLSEYVRMKPPRTAVPSPISYGFLSVIGTQLLRPAGAFMMAAMVLVFGFGTATYAAEGALPGDTLYPLKTQVLEPARVALAPTPEARAQAHMTIAETRITEAAALAQKGRLNEQTETQLASDFSLHTAKAEETEAADTATEEDTTPAKIAFATRLSAYNNILAQIDEDRGSTSTAPLRSVIRAKIAIADENEAAAAPTSAARPMLFAATSARMKAAPNHSEEQVKKLDTNVDLSLKTSTEVIYANLAVLDATSSARVRSELERAQRFAEHGKELLKEGDHEGAYEAFHNSLTTAARVEVLTKAAAQFKVNIFGTSTAASTTGTTTERENKNSDEEAKNESTTTLELGL